MDQEKCIYSLLSSDATLTSLIAGRVFPVKPPEDVALPFVVYRRDDTEAVITLSGANKLNFCTIVVDYYALNYDTEMSLATAIYDALHNTTGDVAGITVDRLLFRTQRSLAEDQVYHGEQVYSLAAQI